MSAHSIYDAIKEIIELSREFLAKENSGAPEKNIKTGKYSNLAGKISIFHERVLREYYPRGIDYNIIYQLVDENLKGTSKYNELYFKGQLVFFLIQKIKPKEEEAKFFLGVLKNLCSEGESDIYVRGLYTNLARSLFMFYPEMVINEFIMGASMKVHIDVIKDLDLKNNYGALAEYLKGMFGKIKSICDGSHGDSYGPELISFLLKYERNADDPVTGIVNDFYFKCMPEGTGNLKKSALIRKLICFATGLTTPSLDKSNSKIEKCIVDGINSNYSNASLQIFRKGMEMNYQFSNIIDILSQLLALSKMPFGLIFSIFDLIENRYNEHSALFYDYAKKISPDFSDNVENMNFSFKFTIVKQIIACNDFSILKSVITEELFVADVIDSACNLINSGYPYEEIFKFCAKKNELILPTIQALQDHILEFCECPSIGHMFMLYYKLIDYLRKEDSSTIIKSILDALNFPVMDSLGLLFLVTSNSELRSLAIVLLQNSYHIWTKIDNKSSNYTPTWKIAIDQIEYITQNRLITDPIDMISDLKEFPKIHSIGTFLNDKTNFYNYVIRLCSLSCDRNEEFTGIIHKMLNLIDNSQYFSGKISLEIASRRRKIDEIVERCNAKKCISPIESLGCIFSDDRKILLEKLKELEVEPDDKVKLIFFILQNVILTTDTIDQKCLEIALARLVENINVLKSGFNGKDPMPSSSLFFAYSILLILQNIKYLEDKKLINCINDAILVDGFNSLIKKTSVRTNKILVPHNNSTGTSFEPHKLVHDPSTILVFKLYIQILIRLVLSLSIQQITNNLNRILKLSDLLPCSVMMNEMIVFCDSLEKIEPSLIEPSIYSIDLYSSEQNIFVYTCLCLKYYKHFSKKINNLLFVTIVSLNLRYLSNYDILKLVQNHQFSGNKYQIPNDMEVSEFFCEHIPSELPDIMKSGTTIISKVSSTSLLDLLIRILKPWARKTTLYSSEDFSLLFGPILLSSCAGQIKSSIIKEILSNIGNVKVALSFAMHYCISNYIFDELTWKSFAIIDQKTTALYILASLANNIKNDILFEIIVQLQRGGTIPEPLFSIGYCILLQSKERKIFDFAEKRLDDVAMRNKLVDLSELLKVKIQENIKFDIIFNSILSLYDHDDVVESATLLIIFNPSKILVDLLKKEPLIMTENVIRRLKYSVACAIAKDSESSTIHSLLCLFPKVDFARYFKKLSLIFFKTNSENACKSIIPLIKENAADPEIIESVLGIVTRGILPLKDLSQFVGNVKNEKLKYWLGDGGDISKEELANVLSYGDSTLIDVIIKKARLIPEGHIDYVLPIILKPGLVNFQIIYPFMKAIDPSFIHFPDKLVDALPSRGISPQNSSIIKQILEA